MGRPLAVAVQHNHSTTHRHLQYVSSA